jgi:Fur family transcriptional regulator, ferric uptake regulator
MLSEERILRQLSQAGYRITRPRRAVVRALLEGESSSSAAQVHERARSHCPGIGLVTIYRTLELLSEEGFVRRIHSQDGCHGYAPTQRGHWHHIVCRHCGAAVEFKGCDLSPFLNRLSQETGYTIEEHLLELVGLCANCQKHLDDSSTSEQLSTGRTEE